MNDELDPTIDPNSLQGGNPSLQGGNPTLQGSSPSLQAPQTSPAAPVYGPPPAPVYGPAVPKTPFQQATSPTMPPVQTSADGLNSTYSQYIGTRPSATSPGTTEYYNKQTGQGFANPAQLFQYASGLGFGTVGSFGQLSQPIAARTTGNTPATPIVNGAPNMPAGGSAPNAQQVASNAGTAQVSPTDLLSLAQAGYPLTLDQYQQIQTQLGIPSLEQTAFQPPSQSTVDFYNQAYQTAGLGDLNQQIQDLTQQISQEQNNITNAQGEINENPFLDEATRSGRTERLNNDAQSYIANLTAQQNNLYDLYNTGLTQVNQLVADHAQDYATTQTAQQAQLSYLQQKAETEGNLQQSQNEQQVLRYLPSYLQSYAASSTPTTVTTPDGSTYAWNKTTGQYTQVTGPNQPGQFVTNPETGGAESFNGISATPIGSGTSGSGAYAVTIPQDIQPDGQPQYAYQNNNPGNLAYAGQQGATPGAGGFAKFSTPEAGYQALQNQITLDASSGLTLGQYITKYAPPTDAQGHVINNTAQYIAQATAALGVPANTPLSQIPTDSLAQWQATKESSSSVAAAPQQQQQGTTSQGGTDATAQAQLISSSPLLQKYVQYTSDGSAYIDQSKLPSQQATAVQYQAGGVIPVLNSGQVDQLQHIDSTQTNLTSLSAFVNQNFGSGVLGKITNVVGGTLGNLLGGSELDTLNEFRTTALNTIQDLAGGENGSIRLSSQIISEATDNLPTLSDSLQQAQNKISWLNNFLNTNKAQLLQTAGSGSSSTPASSGLLQMPSSPSSSGAEPDISDLNFAS